MEDMIRYVEEIVEPTIADLEADPTSVRRAFLACVATFHAVDYLAHPRKPGNIRREFNSRSADFRMVDDLAHAFKHVATGGPNSVSPQSSFLARRCITANKELTVCLVGVTQQAA